MSHSILSISRTVKRNINFLAIAFFAFVPFVSDAQQTSLWHNKEREVHYQPEGENFVSYKGTRKFNRALYGTNTAFRTEAGDLPEFAMYMPGMGGNLKFGVVKEGAGLWLTSASNIKAIYQPGAMHYEVKDKMLGDGKIVISILSRASDEGLILKLTGKDLPKDISLIWAFGGASGKKFSRDGDIGADPESVFYLHPENCSDNVYKLSKDGFQLEYGSGKISARQLRAVFPKGNYKLSDATQQQSPMALWESPAIKSPIFSGNLQLNNQDYYFTIYNPEQSKTESYESLKTVYDSANHSRTNLAGRIKVSTPDKYINTLGGALAIAADAIWESPTFLHGAVAWRMRLNAWRGAYAANVLGWHDRAKLHFSSYANSQVLAPLSGPIEPDTFRNLARQKEEMGNAMFSSGYISRNPNANNKPHHYDMNLVFFDQLFNYFNWTGDTAFLKKMWPVLERHMSWEKRNFDKDGDGLYDAYAAIWASDGLQYTGGGVTHSSAYNYRSNIEMARLAKIIGEKSEAYTKEADHIFKAMQNQLWMPALGSFAEYKDLQGHKLLHPSAGLWTIYHAIDAKVPDHFQAYQMLKYVDHKIPHIPIKANGLEDSYYTLSTTNWQPYTWSVNNVALAELLHTSLAYWQGGNSEEAFKLWKSSLVESMYLGASPGNFQQLSFYDAMRDELYRDFADPVAMAGRSLVEGLFGILPDAMNGNFIIRPGLPKDWDFASVTTPDIHFDFKRKGNLETYLLKPNFPVSLNLVMQLKAYTSSVKSLKVNGKSIAWKALEKSIGKPVVEFSVAAATEYKIEIEWGDELLEQIKYKNASLLNEDLALKVGKASILNVFDPQATFLKPVKQEKSLKAVLSNSEGHKTVFIQLQQGDFSWWQPLDFDLQKSVHLQLAKNQTGGQLKVDFINKTNHNIAGQLLVNGKVENKKLDIEGGANFAYTIKDHLSKGSNRIQLLVNGKNRVDTVITNWEAKSSTSEKFETVNIAGVVNADLNAIFKQKYLSPRPDAVTLQIPTQGIGNWCYPFIDPEIDDSGLRKSAGSKNQILFDNIPFHTNGASGVNNIAFTSLWDNYPDSIQIPLNGKASHVYFLMAGSTNHMQSRFTNAEVKITYVDGTSTILTLNNPENWWPIEQDFYNDGFAFTTDAPVPPRLYLKKGEFIKNYKDYKTIKGFTSYGIEGGAATILDLPLDPNKKLKTATLKTVANEVVVGLMSITLKR